MAAALAGSLVSGGSNITASGLTAGLQILGNTINNNQQQSYNDTVIKRAETAFTDSGLPRYLAYSSNTNMPTQKFQLQGGNFYSAGPVNANLPTYTTQAQQYTHTAAPREPRNQGARIPPVNNFEMNEIPRVNGVPIGQNDRQGLGFGRYAGNFVQGGVMLETRPRDIQQHQQAARFLQ